jgi:hypothetical protein
MSQFQRMVAIPQEEYMQLSAVQNVRQPLTQQFYALENQYNQEAQVQDPYRRLYLQSSTLDDMKQLKEQMRQYISISTPKPYRNRAQALLENISPFVRFNERGEIYDNKENKVIERSRMEDLIQHAVRDRRRNISPVGWRYFVSLLREHNIPKSILNSSTIEEMDQKLEEAEEVESPSVIKHATAASVSPKIAKATPKTSPFSSGKRRKTSRIPRPSVRLLESIATYKGKQYE